MELGDPNKFHPVPVNEDAMMVKQLKAWQKISK